MEPNKGRLILLIFILLGLLVILYFNLSRKPIENKSVRNPNNPPISTITEETSKENRNVEFLSINYPYGETDLRIWRGGRAALFYGALPQHKEISTDIFDIDAVFQELEPLLNENIPTEEWEDPLAEYGSVSVGYSDYKETIHYLIFDGELAEELFKVARKNVIQDVK